MYDSATMGVNSGGLPEPLENPDAKSSPQINALGLTANYATSQLAALTAFFGAIGSTYWTYVCAVDTIVLPPRRGQA